MVLKLKYIVAILAVSFLTNIQCQNKIIFTDKYDVNYVCSENLSNTKLHIASELFQFLEMEMLYECGSFIDSFLTNEKIQFSQNIGFVNNNTFVIDLEQENIQNCRLISNSWVENYNINFQEKLKVWINNLNIDTLINSSSELIFRSLVNSEKSRFFNHGNTVNTITLTFQIPKELISNNFKKVFTHYNTKRYTHKETLLRANEIIYNKDVPLNYIKYTFPTMGRHTFLKNCISMSILEIMYKNDLNFKLDYHVNQVIASFLVLQESNKIDSLKYFFNKVQLSKSQFEQFKLQAINKIIEVSKSNFYYYSYYDIEKLKYLKNDYKLEDFYSQIDLINSKRSFILEINPENKFYYKDILLTKTNLTVFENDLKCKKNSIDLLNESDTIVINKLITFLTINPEYHIAIDGLAKKSEYLFVEKDVKEKLLNKYQSFGYTISKRKKLALFRAISVFDKLYEAGISYSRIKCSGLNSRTPSLSFNIYVND